MKKLLSALILLAGLVSCIKTDNELGNDLIAINQQYDFYTAEFDISDVQMRPVDGLTAYSSKRITIGSIRDETFGLYRRGSVVTLVPVLDTVDFGKDPVFKRFKFKAGPDSVSVSDANQSNILQNVNVYALTEPLDTAKYTSRTEVKYGNKRITKGVPVVNGVDSLVFDFTEEYGKQYLNITQSDLEDFEAYKKKFPGIYICTDDPVGYGGRIDMYEMNILTADSSSGMSRTDNYALLYFNGEFDGERRDSLLMFYFSPLEFQDLDSLINVTALPTQYVFNVDSHESDSMAGQATDKIYVEGGSGLKPMIPAAEISRLVNEEIIKKGGDPKTALISKATIELPFDFPEDYTTIYKYPDILSPTVRIVNDDGTVNYAGLTDASVSTENQGDINLSLCKYYPDITHHVQQIIRQDSTEDLSEYDVWFLVMWYETTSTTDSAAGEMADYYQQMAYYSYYSSLYGGGYGGYGYGSYGGYGYDSYGYGSSYSNYYNYMLMADYYSSSAVSSSTSSELDKDRYYNAVLHGPDSEDKKPKLKITYAIPRN